MTNKHPSIFTCLLLCVSLAAAQNREVGGRVTSSVDGGPLGGVSVSGGGSSATQTDADGAYTINVPADGTLVFSSVGFATQRVAVAGRSIVNVALAPGETALDEVVVTALGIERKASSLTYATQAVKGEDLVRVKDANPMNNLTGRVSGVQINRSASGIGGSVSIILRGAKSNRNNQPLFVLDGLPIANTPGSGNTGFAGDGPPDQGDILSTLNPDDIASINVLKGASASALYGSQGANGAIMITTKKGAAGRTRIDISSGLTIDQAFLLPELQYRYAQTTPSTATNAGSEESWGAAGTFRDHVDGFFDTGTTWLNTVSLSGGTEKAQNYFSYANTANSGVMPTNTFNQHTASFRNSANFFEGRLHFDGSLMYAHQKVHNRPASGLYFNPLPGLYMFPRGQNFDDYAGSNFEYFSPSRNMYMQNWYGINHDKGLTGSHHMQNPYWVLNRNLADQKRDNLVGQASLRLKLTDWLDVAARGTINKRWDHFQRNIYAGTQSTQSGLSVPGKLNDNGRLVRNDGDVTALYGDILLNGGKQWADWELAFTAGTSVNDERSGGWNVDARRLLVANKFNMSNIYREVPLESLNEAVSKRQVQAVFGSANLGWREKIYVDLTARNDWASTLAFTPKADGGYFYWSGGLSAVLSEIATLPAFVTHGKLRFSYAEVGNDVAVYATNPMNTLNTGVLVANASGAYLGVPLKPEISGSYELGLEGRFWNDRISLDLAVYKTNTRDQYFSFGGLMGTVNSTLFLNAGDVENKGVEVSLGADLIRKEGLKWNTGFNLTMNRNKVIALAPNLGEVYDVGENHNVMRVGGSFGDFWGSTFQRDASGTIIVDANGRPQRDLDGYIGNNSPKSIIGWHNTVSYKDLSLSLAVDGRFGGQVIAGTKGYLDSFGVSRESADARDRGGVDVPAVLSDGTPWAGLLPADEWYKGVGNRDGIIEGQVYNATNIRLREVSLGYRLPVKWQSLRQASLALTGRNLFFFRNDAPYDPELNTTTGVGGQGYEMFGLPTTRSYGLTLKATF